MDLRTPIFQYQTTGAVAMRTAAFSLGLVVCWIAAAAADEPRVSSGRMVSLEVVIAHRGEGGGDQAAIDVTDGEKALASIAELEAAGELAAVFRVRLATVDLQPAMIQVGERRPVATGQMVPFGGRRGGEGGAAPALMRSYSTEQVGTLISGTPLVQPDGAVLVELNVEQTRLLPPPPTAEGEDAAAVPHRVATMMSKSTIRLPDGAPVLLGGASSTDGAEKGDAVIVVTARVGPATEATAPAQASVEELRIFALKNLAAADASRVMTELFSGQSIIVAADERTNSLLVKASADQLAEIQAVLLRLDEASVAE
jgi:type II secretory pathway component GspD/PulD (secretin)